MVDDSRKNELVCHFCSVRLDEGTVNTGCHRNIAESHNRSYSNGVMKEFYTTSKVPIECVGNKRHYFGQSSNKQQAITDNNNVLISSHTFPQFSQNFSLKETNFQTNSVQDIFSEEENILDKLKKEAVTKDTTVFAIFQQAYKESDIISSDNIKAFLKKSFSLDEKEINKFLSNFNRNSSLYNSISSSSSQNISFHMSDVFDFLRLKQLNNRYNDLKINKFTNSGLIYAGIHILKKIE